MPSTWSNISTRAQWFGASMAEETKGFLVAGPASGVGKTTVTLALLAALRKKGLVVQPFKCGPDFIDGGHHAVACGRVSRNLDGWMLSLDANREVFDGAALGADVCVIEGAMGLFDGVDGSSEAGSAAEIAKWLGLPVVLVVDAAAAARSAAALVHGFETFDPNLRLAGVIFNNVAGPSHFRLPRDAVAKHCKAPVLGQLPREKRIHIPERHLGLFTAGEECLGESQIGLLAELAASNVDLDQLLSSLPVLRIASRQSGQDLPRRVRIGVARDRAFCFYYEDNLDALRAAGAEIVEFSPLKDRRVPADVDALYIGGGYPELYVERLATNGEMLSSVREFAEAGNPIYAECGGLMYLAEEIVTFEGKSASMVGALPLRVRMTERLVNFGYTEIHLTADCLLGCEGTKVRGHSFHCSELQGPVQMDHVYRTRNFLAGREGIEGFRRKNILASYVHLHFGSNPNVATSFVRNVCTIRGKDHIAPQETMR